MRIVIKRDLCCAAQLCVQAAPDLFRLDELGYNASDGDEVPAGREAEAREAARACPENAVRFKTTEQA
jgi:ferredoxin